MNMPTTTVMDTTTMCTTPFLLGRIVMPIRMNGWNTAMRMCPMHITSTPIEPRRGCAQFDQFLTISAYLHSGCTIMMLTGKLSKKADTVDWERWCLVIPCHPIDAYR